MFGKLADVLFDFGENLFESAENADVHAVTQFSIGKTKVSLYNPFRFAYLLFGMAIGAFIMVAGAILGTMLYWRSSFDLWFYQRFKMTTGDKYWFKKRG